MLEPASGIPMNDPHARIRPIPAGCTSFLVTLLTLSVNRVRRHNNFECMSKRQDCMVAIGYGGYAFFRLWGAQAVETIGWLRRIARRREWARAQFWLLECPGRPARGVAVA